MDPAGELAVLRQLLFTLACIRVEASGSVIVFTLHDIPAQT